MAKNAVVLLHRGDPRTPEEVETWLRALYSDPGATSLPFGQAVQNILSGWIAKMDASSLKERLSATGGKSSWHERVDALAADLEKAFNGEAQGTAGQEWIVRSAFALRPDGLSSLVKQLKSDGITRAIGVSLYPHKAMRRGGAVMQAFLKAFEGVEGISVSVIERLSSDPGYVELLRGQLANAPPGVKPEETTVVFAAPGIEKADMNSGDEYREQVEATAAAVVEKLPWKHKVAWIGEKMPGPLLPNVLASLGAEGCKAALLVPLGTAVDELGVVHALDVEAPKVAREAGITRVDRAPQLVSEPGLVPFLKKTVEDHVLRVGALGLA
jgi:protoporphyrin/coproporphyrin ferrochelatase